MDDTETKKINEMVRTITDHMHFACDIQVDASSQAPSPIAVSIQTIENARFLIGRSGQNLKALEHVVRAMWTKTSPAARGISIDVNDYRKERVAELVAMVKETAGRVRDTKKSEALPPMSSYERRVVHTELASWSDIATESVGQDPQRRVVIKPL